MTTGPRYPNISVKLSGTDGNAFALMGRVRATMRAAGVPDDEVEQMSKEAMSGDYDHLLSTFHRWVNVS